MKLWACLLPLILLHDNNNNNKRKKKHTLDEKSLEQSWRHRLSPNTFIFMLLRNCRIKIGPAPCCRIALRPWGLITHLKDRYWSDQRCWTQKAGIWSQWATDADEHLWFLDVALNSIIDKDRGRQNKNKPDWKWGKGFYHLKWERHYADLCHKFTLLTLIWTEITVLFLMLCEVQRSVNFILFFHHYCCILNTPTPREHLYPANYIIINYYCMCF